MRSAALCEWPRSLLGPVTCPRRLRGERARNIHFPSAGTCQIRVPAPPPRSPKVCSLWSSSVLCPQSLVIFCTMSAVFGHLLYCVRSLWSSSVLCLQSLVISCTM
ncbi:unnamed protein product, partial [Staurois parvus]